MNIHSDQQAKEGSVESTKVEPGFLTNASLQGFNPTPSMKTQTSHLPWFPLVLSSEDKSALSVFAVGQGS